MSTILNKQHLWKLSNSQDNNQLMELLQLYATYQPKMPAVIKNYHDILLFHCAFPFNEQIYALAISEIKRVATMAKAAYDSPNTKLQKSLLASGIANTDIECAYSSAIASWLVKKFPEAVELDLSEAAKESVRNILQLLLPSIEYEKASQGELGLKARLTSINRLHQPADLLKCLLQLFENSQLPLLVKEALYLQLKVFIKWKLGDDLFNRSFLKHPVKKIYFQKDFLKKVNSNTVVKQKNILPVPLSASGKSLLLDTMKASLALYYRETEPVTYADEQELELFDMGRGLQIALVGMTKEKRLALESYEGFMAFKNGVLVAYGGGWIWGQRCKIGVNIYPPFRRGESAWIFCQVLRLYYQHFGVRHFIVKPYQFGKGNPEGLKSGAFWFYYKLGFRPAKTALKSMAAEEWEKIQTIKNYRSPLKTLQSFTAGNLEWLLSKKTFPAFDAGVISAAVSDMINKEFNCNRAAAIATCSIKMKNNFSAPTVRCHNLYQQQVVENWSLLTTLIDDIQQWNIGEKRGLIQLIKLKQTGKERDYIIQLQKHERLWKSLDQVVLNRQEKVGG